MDESAQAAALRFLKIRPRSIGELRERLKIKGFSQAEIEITVLDLMARGLLDDRAFTKSWINYRLARPFGFKRIITELKAKGVDKAIIQQAVVEMDSNYSEEDTALALARRRWQKFSDIDPGKKKKRLEKFRPGMAEAIAGVSSCVWAISEGIQYDTLFKGHGATLGCPPVDVRHQKWIGQPHLESVLHAACVPLPGLGSGDPRQSTPARNPCYTRDGAVFEDAGHL